MALVQRLARSAKDQYIIPESLTHSTGVITATVNGVNYTCTLSGLTANTLYFLYLRPGQANIQFVTTVPSSYRASFPQAILIGAFYANGLSSVAFGSFINVDSIPTSGEIQWNCIPTIPGGTNPTKGTTSLDRATYYRHGNILVARHEYIQTTTGTAGSGGNGQYYWSLPGVTVDTANYTPAGGNGYQVLGSGFIYNSSVLGQFWMIQLQDTGQHFRYLTTNQANIQGTGSYPLSQTSVNQGAIFQFPVAGWSNTPLKDL